MSDRYDPWAPDRVAVSVIIIGFPNESKVEYQEPNSWANWPAL